MTAEQFAPVMFGALVATMLVGFPVAFSLAALGLACGLIAIAAGWFPAAFLGNLPLNLYGILSNELLLAIPFFTLMGAILEKCGLAEDLLESMGQLFGPLRGGIGYSVIIVGFILGAITGTVAGQVIAMAIHVTVIDQKRSTPALKSAFQFACGTAANRMRMAIFIDFHPLYDAVAVFDLSPPVAFKQRRPATGRSPACG